MGEKLTKDQADLMALAFLRDHGPHTVGPIEDESAFAAAFIFAELARRGLATSTDFGNGNVQYAIAPTGRDELESSHA